MDEAIILAAKLGFLGGMARCGFALIKAFLSKKQIDWKAFGFLIVINALSGTFLAAVLNLTPTISLLAGYASFDILESSRQLFRLSAVKVPIKASTKSIRKSIWERTMEYN